MVTMDVDNAPTDGGGIINVATVSAPSMKETNELRYSRLIHTLGREAVSSLQHSRVLIVGCKGVGAEVAKNLVMSGVQGLGLVDDEPVAIADLGAQFLLSAADVGRNRAVATAHKLKESINPSIEIVTLTSGHALESAVGSYGAMVATVGTLPELIRWNSICRSLGVPFVAAICRGVFSSVFVDFGDDFSILDETGEPPGVILVEGITQDFPATVTVVEEQRHGLEDGDEVVFNGIKGMEDLNRSTPYAITVAGVNSFTIQEDTRSYGRYLSGGYFSKVKTSKRVEFMSLERALVAPKFCVSDPVKESRALHLHVAFQAVDEFERRRRHHHHNGENNPSPLASSSSSSAAAISSDQLHEVVALAREIWTNLDVVGVGKGNASNGSFSMEESAEAAEEEEPAEVVLKTLGEREQGLNEERGAGCSGVNSSIDGMAAAAAATGVILGNTQAGPSSFRKKIDIDEEFVRLLAQGAHVELCPVAAVTGGIAAQEAMKVPFSFSYVQPRGAAIHLSISDDESLFWPTAGVSNMFVAVMMVLTSNQSSTSMGF